MSKPIVLFRLSAEPADQLLELFDECEEVSHDLDMVIDRVLRRAAGEARRPLLASASLDVYHALLAELDSMQAGDEQRGSRDRRQRLRTARAVAGYLSRASSRCTPFGLLATVGLAKVEPKADLVMTGAPEDDTAVAVLAPYLGAQTASQFDRWMEDYPDPVAYRVRGRLRTYVLEDATWKIREYPDAEDGASRRVKAPLAATEPRAVEQLLSRVGERSDCPSSQRAAASAVLASIEAINGAVTPAWTEKYEECQKSIDSLISETKPELLRASRRASRLVLITRVSGESITVGEPLLDEIRRAVSLVHSWFRPTRISALDEFRDALRERCGDGLVPLLQALDPGHGIGYLGGDPGSLEIADQPLNVRSRGNAGYEGGNPRLAELLVTAARAGKDSINCADSWNDDLVGREFAVLGSVAADDRFLLDAAFIGDAFEFVGRFGHDVPGLAEAMRKQVCAREDEGVVDAEIAYLPHGVDANVVRRASAYRHQIVCEGRAAAGTIAIPVNELSVGVDGNVIRLWWAKGNCWIRPRLSCAHNTAISRYPVYRFLADLARSPGGWLAWKWGQFETLRSLPEVTFGRVQLSPRMWNINRAEFKRLARLSLRQRVVELDAIREEHRIPRYVQAGYADQYIEVDLQNPVFLDVVFHKAKRVEMLALRESRISKTAVVDRGGSMHCNELAIAFPQAKPRARKPVTSAVGRLSGLEYRGFSPGSEWLSLKIFEETSVLETMLLDKLIPWADELRSRGAVDKWYYLRYRDPRNQLRLRLHGAREVLMDALAEAHDLMQSVEFVVDGYVPEVRRYGGEVGMHICESIFMADSYLAGEIVQVLPLEFAAKRWEMSIGFIDGMLGAAEISPIERSTLCEEMAKNCAAIVGVDLSENRHLNKSYRARRARIEEAVATAREQLKEHWGHGEDIARLAACRDKLDSSVALVLSSLIHMHLNRVLGPRQVEQELIVYDYLRRFYRSEAARE